MFLMIVKMMCPVWLPLCPTCMHFYTLRAVFSIHSKLSVPGLPFLAMSMVSLHTGSWKCQRMNARRSIGIWLIKNLTSWPPGWVFNIYCLGVFSGGGDPGAPNDTLSTNAPFIDFIFSPLSLPPTPTSSINHGCSKSH